MKSFPDTIPERRDAILAEIDKAAKDNGRSSADITLVAVSKKQPESRIQAMLDTGHRVFGENRVQEAQSHWQSRREAYPDVELRLIGPLQTNKAVDAVELFDVIETLDRPKLAKALVKAMDKTGRTPRLYVQVNTGEEPQKAGVIPSELPAFLDQCRSEFGLCIDGLMCIPPLEDPASPHFALLARLAEENGLDKLSMGMSGDYQTAIGLGATSVRVGSALFGERED